MKIKVSCDDGCQSDMKLATILKRYDLGCTFYLPVEWHSLAYEKGYKPLNFAQAKRLAIDFEIGSHSITHRHLTKLSEEEALYEIEYSRLMLRDLLDTPIVSFCPPRGYTNERLTALTLDHYVDQRLTKGEHEGYKLVHVHPNSGANDNKPWRECVTEKTHLWLHSWELDLFELWDELEDFLEDSCS